MSVLRTRSLSKSFGGARALDDVSLTVEAGEIHGLLGENGSGKSTLIRILAGYHAPEPGGALEVNGEPVELPVRPGLPRSLGMSFVHQELALIPSLSVAENLLLGDLAVRRWSHISWSREHGAARETLARFGLEIDPTAKVAGLRPVERALLAIVRAMEGARTLGLGGRRGRLLVLDEPTALLPKTEVEQVFASIRGIAAEGAGVLFVTHDLDEALGLTDRITVLRGGRAAGTFATPRVAREELVEAIVGHRVKGFDPQRPDAVEGRAAVRVTRLSGRIVQDVSLALGEGEVLGLTGPAGSGYDEVPYLLFGARPCTAGSLALGGADFDLRTITPYRARRAGMALLPADRQRDGSAGALAVADNVTLPVLDRYARGIRLERRRMLDDTAGLLELLAVRPGRPTLPYAALSGGNQQKALLAKWLNTEPRLLLLDEPTQGVDVGARDRILELVRNAAEGGTSILCTSTDDELLGAVCDRVAVFSGGRIAQEL